MDSKIAQTLETFFSQFKTYVYKKGEIIIRAGDAPLGIFYLKKGKVKQYSISRNGDEIVVNIFKPISYFPMSWAINDTKNDYFFEAMENLEVIRAPKEKVIEFFKGHPELVYNLLSRVFRGLDGILQRMTYFMSGSAYLRLATELVIMSKRFGRADGKTLTVVTTERDLAAQTGMTRETVSREMKLLKQKGFLSIEKGGIVIHDIQKLEAELLFSL